MAQKENGSSTSFCSWLHHSYKCKFSSLTIILFSLLLVQSCHGKNEHFYLDLVSREGFACSEVNSFVNEFDPFYRWILSSSLPIVLSTTASVDIDIVNSAYQQASVWRVIGNETPAKEVSNLYASAEPHVAGGRLKQHRRNLQWRMQVDWGISLRMCLSTGIENSNRSCLWTTPIISMENEADLSMLLIGSPYRAATAPGIQQPDLNNMNSSKTGYYLTNYASNARADFIKYQKLNTSSHYYLTSSEKIPKCGFSPSYYSPDATAYLGLLSLQCGCSNSSTSKVCVVATSNIDTNNWGLFDYRSPCDSLKSYWAWNTGGDDFIVLTAYNTSSDKPTPFVAKFRGTFNMSLTSITANALQVMANATACVEAMMQQSPVPSEQEVEERCSTGQLEMSTEHGNDNLEKMRRYTWVPTPPHNNISLRCLEGLRLGQLEFKDKLCVTKLDTVVSTEIKEMVGYMLELRDLKFKQNKLWKQGSTNRHEAYGAILSAVVSFLGACFLATSHNLQDMEEWFQKQKEKWFKRGNTQVNPTDSTAQHEVKGDRQKEGSDPIMTWFKFLYRSAMVLIFAGLVGYTTYITSESVKKERDILQAQTVPQVLSDGTVVLLTTTATYEIKPLRGFFFAICALTLLAVMITLRIAWYKLNKSKGHEDSKSN